MPSSVPQFPCLRSTERLGVEEKVAGQGLKQRRRELGWGHRTAALPIAAAGCASLPPRLRPQGTASGPRLIVTLCVPVLQTAPPGPSHTGKSHSLPSAVPQEWRGGGAGKRERPSATRHRRLPSHRTGTGLGLLRDSPAFAALPTGLAPKGGPQTRTPLPLPSHPSAHHFLPQFPTSKAMSHPSPGRGEQGGCRVSPRPQHPKASRAGPLPAHPQPPAIPCPAPTSGAAESCLGKQLPPSRAARAPGGLHA